MQKLVNLKINNKEITVPCTYTVLEAANENGIFIPRLCHFKDVSENSSCRLCVVEIAGIKGLKNSCSLKVSEGMDIKTNTPRIRATVKQILELMAINHNFECWVCPREGNCEFLNLLRKYGVTNYMADQSEFNIKTVTTNNLNDAIVIDSSKCILCGRCVSACKLLSGVSVLDYNERGFITYVATAQNYNIEDAGCIYCGKCIQHCPTGALREKEQLDLVDDLLNAKEYYLVAQTAPAVRAALGEEFGFPIGSNVEGKMYHAISLLGFDDITDTNFAADLTILEEGTELLSRIVRFQKGLDAKLPLFTSCSPGWIRYVERYYPEYLGHISTCKSPQQMQGAVIKHYYAKKLGIPKEKIKVVSIMPCIAKKAEAKRPEMVIDGVSDVDYVLTTREFARLIRRHDIDFANLSDLSPKGPLATYTGAAAIFGVTGGVMEAALRTVVEKLTNKPLEKLEFTAARGIQNGIKEASILIDGLEINVAVVHGTANVPALMEKIKQKQYHFVEVMACTGGCVNGGGQPIIPAHIAEHLDIRKERAKALYKIDDEISQRKSHANVEVLKLYDEFLGQPNSEIAHKYLHTHYSPKKVY